MKIEDHSNTTAKVEKFAADLNKRRQDLIIFIKKEFGPACQNLFSEFPKLESFSWYSNLEYNDETDAFTIHDQCGYGLSINGLDNYEDYENRNKEIWNGGKYGQDGVYIPNVNYDRGFDLMCAAVENFVGSYREEIEKYFNMNKVVVTKDGIKIEDYE